jgi:urate oxidase
MLGPNSYGKSGIRVVRISRGPDRHDIKDLTVAVSLEGNFEAAHVAGDNSAVLPTDTMKNTVYAFAAETPLDPIEGFALALARHFVKTRAPAGSACVEISEHLWERLDVSGLPHGSAFRRPGGETRVTQARVGRGGGEIVESGLEGLVLIKTARSGFAGFARDRFTTLRETDDRLLATALEAAWTYASPDLSFALLRTGIRQTLLETFAEHESRSVQHTLYAMGEAVLERYPDVVEIRLSMPNKHHLPVDLAPFGLENRNEVFVATEEPYGLIEAKVCRPSAAQRPVDRR